jgi:hypothetical protein
MELEEMRSQSKALQVMATATTGQMNQAATYNRLSLSARVAFEREQAGTGEVGLFIANYGTGPAVIRNVRVYLDGGRIRSISDLEYVDAGNYRVTPHWDRFNNGPTLPSNIRRGALWTSAENIVDINKFRNLILNRIFIIAQGCSTYGDCVTFCTSTTNDRCLSIERSLHGGTVARGAPSLPQNR